MIVERLQYLLLNEGWYLHKWEVLDVNGHRYLRGRVRFPCRPYCDFGYLVDSFITAEKIFKRIKEHVNK